MRSCGAAAAAVHQTRRGVFESGGVSESEDAVSESGDPRVLAPPQHMISVVFVAGNPQGNLGGQKSGNPVFCVVRRTHFAGVDGAASGISPGPTPRRSTPPFPSERWIFTAGKYHGSTSRQKRVEGDGGLGRQSESRSYGSPSYLVEAYWIPGAQVRDPDVLRPPTLGEAPSGVRFDDSSPDGRPPVSDKMPDQVSIGVFASNDVVLMLGESPS
ncbi:uncharacterized protein LOC133545901 [Nerophis ophidion]|uniref:uncharacterized protein LOC133545899 n=1 Tax=Nerophis ophidion TaxID=159077 RepID=UPI002ADFDA81|nr:uncharacterized protein LOC133545899 [Nerophis ophidion]XP_061747602.1 uncharacterized protein LOC133545900 [Nerophis ophidion]XP_061747603.1 uncharacterized protein LOC133545901 [Nerophis ophidion]